MQFPDTAGANARSAPRPRHASARSQPDESRATCRAHGHTIAACDRPGNGQARPSAGAVFAVRLPCDARAPGAARIVVAQRLHDRIAAGVLERAQLVVSELVTNSVRHSGTGRADAVIVRVSLSRTMVRLEVEDAGRGGVIAPRPPDLDSGGGFGLQLVEALSDRWGLERSTPHGTIVWALLPRTPVAAPAPTHEPLTPAPNDRS
jgi:anti-sigma regulatory factor (Ser/Thr protein kinase)